MVPVLFTFYIQDVLKLKKNNSGAKRLKEGLHKGDCVQYPGLLVCYVLSTGELVSVWLFRIEFLLRGSSASSSALDPRYEGTQLFEGSVTIHLSTRHIIPEDGNSRGIL